MRRSGDYEVVFRGNPLEAENLRCALESDGIQAFVWDEQFSKAVMPGLLGRVRLVVSASDAEQAKRLIGSTT